MKNKILFLIFIFHLNILSAQNWPVFFDDSINYTPTSIFECYDKGYNISGSCFLNPIYRYGWLMKTNINGDKLWVKYFGRDNARSYFHGAKSITEGHILIGGTTEYQNNVNPLLVKLNNCAEKEWCKIFRGLTNNAGGQDVVPMVEGGYMILVSSFKSNSDLWLLRLDHEGNLQWEQQYVSDISKFNSPYSRNLIRTSDSCFLITGYAYSPDSLYPGYLILKIFMVKVTPNGDVIFEEPFGNDNGLISDNPHTAVEDSGNTYFTAGRIARPAPPSGDSPTLFKVSSTGQLLFYTPLITTSEAGGCGPLIQFLDSNLAMSAKWSYGSIDTLGVLKTDRNGNLLAKKAIITNNEGSMIWAASRTYNDRFIGAGTFQSDLFAVKLRSDLEYDSIYTQQYTYDSLCPYPITTDTIPVNDCQIITSVFDKGSDLSKTRLHIYPNPASSTLTIVMPEYLMKKSSAYGITSTTCYHQWDVTQLEIFDLFGKILYTQKIPQQEKQVKIDISAWPPGMYLTRLLYKNYSVASEKFMILK